MLFSIIIPTYNSSKTIVRCLDSIIKQNFTSYEVWFIDGNSSDDTLTILTDYKQEYPFINLICEKDEGIYDAMNKGINLSKGEWLYFLGSDDTLFNESVLNNIAKTINASKDKEVVYGNVMMRGENQWNLNNVVFDGEYSIEKFIDRNICHQAMFFKRSVFKKNGNFSLKYVTNADFDFNMRCYSNSLFLYTDVIVANFYVGGQSTLVEDKVFHQHRGALLYRYFGRRIFGSSFINARLYVQQAALSKTSSLSGFPRLICLLAYSKLKIHSMLIS
ncbi:glycosyltransferase family 2 protein [Pedobacter agri]|uniref:glycosyltransferase family 2 protein n=1 Tax=Pedobacter agri TaxID=454586 RepID=UPI00292F2A70|nr:glycosyltransferase family 2 protein [Pedobacter agri]